MGNPVSSMIMNCNMVDIEQMKPTKWYRYVIMLFLPFKAPWQYSSKYKVYSGKRNEWWTGIFRYFGEQERQWYTWTSIWANAGSHRRLPVRRLLPPSTTITRNSQNYRPLRHKLSRNRTPIRWNKALGGSFPRQLLLEHRNKTKPTPTKKIRAHQQRHLLTLHNFKRYFKLM